MIACPAWPRPKCFARAAVLAGIAAVFVTLLIAWPRFAPGEVRPGNDPGHADQQHGGEKFPPEVIRACLASMVMPYEYTNGGQVAFLCRLTANRYGIQIVDAASRREIISFYGTLTRRKHILTRDGYAPIVPLP